MPTKTIRMPFDRLYSSGFASLIGSHMPATAVNDGVTGGAYFKPVRTPCDMDITRPWTISLLLECGSSTTSTAKRATAELRWTSVEPSGAPTNRLVSSFSQIEIPAGTGAGTCLLVPYYKNLAEYSVDAGILTPDTWFAFRLAFTRASATDTYTGQIAFANVLLMTYYQRCQKLCC